MPQRKVSVDVWINGCVSAVSEPSGVICFVFQVMCILTSSPLGTDTAGLWELWNLREKLVSCLLESCLAELNV